MNTTHSILIVLVIALVTFLTRALPFVLFPANKETPKFILYLGQVLPYAIISMLVVYCLKDVSLLNGSHGIPELISMTLITVLHLWKKNTLISIGAGTIVYMILVQLVFV